MQSWVKAVLSHACVLDMVCYIDVMHVSCVVGMSLLGQHHVCVCICMYVLYVCIYVCMYVCMYACMHAYTYMAALCCLGTRVIWANH